MDRRVRPLVLVAGRDGARAAELAAALPGAELRAVMDAESLLRETHLDPPDVVVLCGDLPSRLPLPDLLSILRGRAELQPTHWLAVDTGEVGAAGPDVRAPTWVGADAQLDGAASGGVLAGQVDALLERSRQAHDLAERAATLQRRMEGWEHEERVRDQLVHMLVHDLKNPIAAILGLLELVEDDARLPDDLGEMVHLAREEAQHLLHLSLNMLDVRKIQAGKMRLRTEEISSATLREIVELARGDVGAGLSERHLRLELPQEMAPALADPEILRRIYANLLSNAMKHTTAGGTIGVRAQPLGNELLCTIQDDGEGIPAEDIPNLFAAFEQSRLTLHGRFDTGMGLAFCKLAVEGHGGRIWVESQRGRGAVFSFTLPLAREAEEEDDFADLLV